MLKKLLAISILSIVIGATKVVAMTATVEHGLFGKLEVVDHKDDIKAYNNWCLSQKQSVDNTDFLAISYAEKCFKFDDSISETSYSRTEAEDLLKSISKNPVAASAMKVLISKYNKYDEKILPKCGFTKDMKSLNAYTNEYKFRNVCLCINEHNINVSTTNEMWYFDIDTQGKQLQLHKGSIKRILTHEMMHFMDTVLILDEYNSNKLFIGNYDINYLDEETLKRNAQCNSLETKIDEAANKLKKQLEDKLPEKAGMSSYLQRVLRGVYDKTDEMYGMYGLKEIYHKATHHIICNNDEDDDDGEDVKNKQYSTHDYKLAYEPINDAMSHLYGFGKDDDIVGKIRTSHGTGLNKHPSAISILEDSFHIYSFYKQPDVLKAFELATKVIEEV